MATDFAIDTNTGDLVISPNNDISLTTGQKTVAQQIILRLRIIQGEWPLDPTLGQLGSQMRELMRLPAWRIAGELPLVIREALEPMREISIVDVNAQVDINHANQVNVLLRYVITEDGEAENDDVQVLTTTIVAEG